MILFIIIISLPARSIRVLMTLKAISSPRLSTDVAATQDEMVFPTSYAGRGWRRRWHSGRRRVTDPGRLPNQVLRDERIEHQQNDAGDEEEESKGGSVIELGPEFFPPRPTRWLRIVLLDPVHCQPDDWTVVCESGKWGKSYRKKERETRTRKKRMIRMLYTA